MDIYHYDDTGLYKGTTDARPDPLEDGKFLIPRNATKVKPPAKVLSGDMLGYWIGNSWSSVPLPKPEDDEPGLEEVRALVLDAIDKKTSGLIQYGWIYKDQPVRLTQTDQINFEGEKNGMVELENDGIDVSDQFPLEIKVWTGADGEPVMLAMGSLAEYKEFIREGKKYIREVLDAGWKLKRQVIGLTLEQLKAWADPRNA